MSSNSVATVDLGSWIQVLDLAVALVLTAIIGLERELRAKSAGLRTHTLVGIGAALFMLISKYGFSDIIAEDHVSLDPSRVAAQVVSGIGFIGGGLIFVRGDAVRGLTTAATVWVSAAVGMAAGAGLWSLAAATTIAHLIVVFGITAIARRLPKSGTAASVVEIVYLGRGGTLSRVLERTTAAKFAVARLQVDPPGRRTPWVELDEDGGNTPDDLRRVRFVVTGTGSLADLAVTLEEMAGVLAVTVDDANADVE